MTRTPFCGVIEGSVVVRPGETEDEARFRAELTINQVLGKHCKRLGRPQDPDTAGPVVGLEEV